MVAPHTLSDALPVGASQAIAQESTATRLRRVLSTGHKLIVCPGVYDGLSARIALDVGFDALYMVRRSRL